MGGPRRRRVPAQASRARGRPGPGGPGGSPGAPGTRPQGDQLLLEGQAQGVLGQAGEGEGVPAGQAVAHHPGRRDPPAREARCPGSSRARHGAGFGGEGGQVRGSHHQVRPLCPRSQAEAVPTTPSADGPGGTGKPRPWAQSSTVYNPILPFVPLVWGDGEIYALSPPSPGKGGKTGEKSRPGVKFLLFNFPPCGIL